jgi:dTDP-glucose 4,6-dehydratase
VLFQPKRVLLTGGAGFIGSALVRGLVALEKAVRPERIVVLDALTYAGHLANLEGVLSDVTFVEGNICDATLVTNLFREHAIDSVLHLAAETHVDRSIENARVFVETNVTGTLTLLSAALAAWDGATESRRFVHVSTDEVFGTLGETGHFTEDSPYAPNSPYAASKASSDLIVRSFHKTYGLPTIITNTCNNYGPRQLPEKLIPLMATNAVEGKRLPVYGAGKQVREWLHVDDHCEGLWAAITKGKPGESYNFGSGEERANITLVGELADVVDDLTGKPRGTSRELISFVQDRKGHDFRYAIDSAKAKRELGWQPRRLLATALNDVVSWYIKNETWRRTVSSAEHARFQSAYYDKRKGNQ